MKEGFPWGNWEQQPCLLQVQRGHQRARQHRRNLGSLGRKMPFYTKPLGGCCRQRPGIVTSSTEWQQCYRRAEITCQPEQFRAAGPETQITQPKGACDGRGWNKNQWLFLQCHGSLFQFFCTDLACVFVAPASGCSLSDKRTNSLKQPRASHLGDWCTHCKGGTSFSSLYPFCMVIYVLPIIPPKHRAGKA